MASIDHRDGIGPEGAAGSPESVGSPGSGVPRDATHSRGRGRPRRQPDTDASETDRDTRQSAPGSGVDSIPDAVAVTDPESPGPVMGPDFSEEVVGFGNNDYVRDAKSPADGKRVTRSGAEKGASVDEPSLGDDWKGALDGSVGPDGMDGLNGDFSFGQPFMLGAAMNGLLGAPMSPPLSEPLGAPPLGSPARKGHDPELYERLRERMRAKAKEKSARGKGGVGAETSTRSGESTASTDKGEGTEEGHEIDGRDSERVTRLLRIAQSIREDPFQPMEELQARLGIAKSQFYKDKATLAKVGFRFEYSRAKGFHITEDRLTPITGLTVSDRLVLLSALEQLCVSGDGALAALAVEAGRKLLGGLPSSMRFRLEQCFVTLVTGTLGVRSDVWQALRDALESGQRVKILYTRSGTWETRWRVVDPRYIYIREGNLYLYARTADETPCQWKVFRLSRMGEVRPTGITVRWRPGDDGGFMQKRRNAFSVFLGTEAYPVVIRFTGQAVHYVMEKQWHSSQVVERQPDGSILFTVRVAEPMEVVRWSRQFGDEAEVVHVGGKDAGDGDADTAGESKQP